MEKKYNESDINKKLEIIEASEKGMQSQRKIAERFKISKSQVQRILKNKEEIKRSLEKFEPTGRKRLKLTVPYAKLDSILFQWFVKARGKNLPISGPLLQNKALKIAEVLNLHGFKASNGWLQSFRKRYNINFGILSGEGADVDISTVDAYRSTVQRLCEGYEPSNIFNLDETGLFFRATPTKSLVLKNEKCSGGKLSKERLTVALLCSFAGEKENLLVIGKAKRPRSFGRTDIQQHLNITWRSNSKAWMTGTIFSEWMHTLDAKMHKEKRKIIIFLDNAACHAVDNLNYIKLQYLPPNCTSHLQPLDQGIIQNLKVNYRSHVMSHLVCCLDEVEHSSELARKISVFNALCWLKSAWDKVNNSTIQKCFLKCGFPLNTCGIGNEDVILAVNESPVEENLKELADIDSSLATYETLPENWEESFFQQIEHNVNDTDVPATESDVSSSDESVALEVENEASTILNVKDAILQIRSLKEYSLKKDLPTVFQKLNECEILIESAHVACIKKQTKISDFFKNMKS